MNDETNNNILADDSQESQISDNSSDIERLKTTNAAIRKEKNQLAAQVAELKRQMERTKDIDPDRYHQLLTEADARAQRELEEKGNYQQSLQIHQDRTKAAEDKAAAAEEKARALAVQRELVLAFGKAGGNPDYLDHFIKTVPDGIRQGEGGIEFPPTLREDGSAIESLNDYVSYLRDNGGLGIYFLPQSRAQGSNDLGGRPVAAPTPAMVPMDQAGKYLDQIANGEIQIQGM